LLLHEVSHLGANGLFFGKLFKVIEVRFPINFALNNGASGNVVG
jgi:hypothetical protein